MPLSQEDKIRLFGALRSELNKLPVQKIRNTVAAAGFDVSQITARAEARSGLGSKSRGDARGGSAVWTDERICTKRRHYVFWLRRLTGQNSELDASTQDILGYHGYQFVDGNFVPVQELDAREAQFISPSAATELGRAMSRLIEGDYSGAITSACGAVDLVTQVIYENHNLGNPGTRFVSNQGEHTP